MKSSRRGKRILLVFIGTVCAIALMGTTLRLVEPRLPWVALMVNDSIAFVQHVVQSGLRPIVVAVDDWRQLRTIVQEHAMLKALLAQYARDAVRLNTLESENARLKEALAFTQRQKSRDVYTYRLAAVISESPDRYNRVVKIDLGARDGIRMHMAVMTTEGLIGRISQVFPFSANVQLLSDLTGLASSPTRKALAVTAIGRERVSFGMIERYDAQQGTLLMTKIDPNDPLSVGDRIVTSGLGELFPKGLDVGVVESRRVGDTGLTHMAIVRPAARMNNLHEVFVVEVPGVE